MSGEISQANDGSEVRRVVAPVLSFPQKVNGRRVYAGPDETILSTPPQDIVAPSQAGAGSTDGYRIEISGRKGQDAQVVAVGNLEAITQALTPQHDRGQITRDSIENSVLSRRKTALPKPASAGIESSNSESIVSRNNLLRTKRLGRLSTKAAIGLLAFGIPYHLVGGAGADVIKPALNPFEAPVHDTAKVIQLAKILGL